MAYFNWDQIGEFFNWDQAGEIASLAQLTGLDSVKLISLIVKAANDARSHQENCRQFAQHLKLIGILLEQLKHSDLKRRPETRELMEELEEALRKAYLLVNSCKDKSYLYLLAFGWTTVSQFQERQAEIDRLLGLIPLVTLVENNREHLRAIETDERVYTLDEEESKVHEVILKPEVTESDARILEKSLSRSYPGWKLDEVLKTENKKLRMELHCIEEEGVEMDQVEVIHHLIDVTETVVPQNKGLRQCSSKSKRSKRMNSKRGNMMETHQGKLEGGMTTVKHLEPLEESTPTSPRQDVVSSPDEKLSKKHTHQNLETWHHNLCDCCMDPYLCVSTCMYPCGTFTDVAAFASDGKISPEEACNNVMTYSLMFCCFCYTCCFRRKLRKRFNIQGGCCEDFCTHVLCFYCALIQEWNEILAREGKSLKMSPPSPQTMEREETDNEL